MGIKFTYVFSFVSKHRPQPWKAIDRILLNNRPPGGQGQSRHLICF